MKERPLGTGENGTFSGISKRGKQAGGGFKRKRASKVPFLFLYEGAFQNMAFPFFAGGFSFGILGNHSVPSAHLL